MDQEHTVAKNVLRERTSKSRIWHVAGVDHWLGSLPWWEHARSPTWFLTPKGVLKLLWSDIFLDLYVWWWRFAKKLSLIGSSFPKTLNLNNFPNFLSVLANFSIFICVLLLRIGYMLVCVVSLFSIVLIDFVHSSVYLFFFLIYQINLFLNKLRKDHICRSNKSPHRVSYAWGAINHHGHLLVYIIQVISCKF